MVQMMVLVNLIFVPVISLYWIYKKKGKSIVRNMELLFQYCIATACNIPLAKAFTVIIGKITGKQIFLDSGYYTAAALASAVIIAWIYLNIRIEIIPAKAEVQGTEAGEIKNDEE